MEIESTEHGIIIFTYVDVIIMKALKVLDENVFDQFRVENQNCRVPQFIIATKSIIIRA
jgi:hypothetical protein